VQTQVSQFAYSTFSNSQLDCLKGTVTQHLQTLKMRHIFHLPTPIMAGTKANIASCSLVDIT